MSVPVALDELATALAARANAAYLLTVGDDGRVHCVASTVRWREDELVVPAGATSVRNATARGSVVLLSPPAQGLPSSRTGSSLDAYSLIVDAEVTGCSSADGPGGGPGTAVHVRPAHAVFHRPAPGSGTGEVGHDCVHVYEEATPRD